MDDDNIIPRIGTFFIALGSGFIILFVASDLAKSALFDLFFVGVLMGGFGLYLRRKITPPPPSGRFETWRNIRAGKYQEEQAQKRTKQQQENAARKQSKKEEREAKKAAKKGG